jgi:hypothetical protein
MLNQTISYLRKKKSVYVKVKIKQVKKWLGCISTGLYRL